MRGKQPDALADIAGHLNTALEAGHRSLGVQAGIVEAVAQQLRDAGWTAVVMPAQGAQVTVLVCSAEDPASWQAFVKKTGTLTVPAPPSKTNGIAKPVPAP